MFCGFVIYANDVGEEWQDVYVCSTVKELKKAIVDGCPLGYHIIYEGEIKKVERPSSMDIFVRTLNDKDKEMSALKS